MAELAPVDVDYDGVDPNFVAATVGGDTVPYQRGLRARVRSSSGIEETVTIATHFDAQPGAGPVPKDIPVPAGEEVVFKLDHPNYRDPVSGDVALSYSAAASLEIAIERG